MSVVRLRYWAAARDAAGLELEEVSVDGWGEVRLSRVLDTVRRAHDERFARVLRSSSLLVDGVAVGHLDPGTVTLADGAVVEVLPPFAGG